MTLSRRFRLGLGPARAINPKHDPDHYRSATELERQSESPAGAGAGSSHPSGIHRDSSPGSRVAPGRLGPGQPGKLEHFSEETTTVVVFAQGAVVRLVGSAKAGQLVGLTNRQTGKEALCRIVNIKHFPDTRGYVEIEFNHAMNGFWQTALSQEAPAFRRIRKKMDRRRWIRWWRCPRSSCCARTRKSSRLSYSKWPRC
jgi:hypothetical protein